jgi:Amidohydrolase
MSSNSKEKPKSHVSATAVEGSMRKTALWVSLPISLLICGSLIAISGFARAMADGQTTAVKAPAESARGSSSPAAKFTAPELRKFTALSPIDVHTHVYKTDPVFIAMLQQLNIHILDLLVADVNDTASHRSFGPLRQDAWQFVSSSDGHASLSTTFDPFDWNSPVFPGSAIHSINHDFARGAVAVTIWANTGMSMKSASSLPALPDDPKLEPVYQDMARHNKTLMAHIGKSDEVWVADRAAAPAVPAILQARDRILKQNPHLRVVAAHFGSLTENLDQLGSRLERYPNLAVDTSSRMDFLMTQPREQVVTFFLKFQDRILYGTDSSFHQNDSAGVVIPKWQNRYAMDWRYLASDDTLEFDGRQIRCLHLPEAVLRKIYHDNAVRWVPGIAK